MKDTGPCGVILMRNLAVLWCLYEDQVCARANRSEGLSTMTAHDGKFSLKDIGIVSRRFSRSGKWRTKWIDEYMV